MRIVSFTVTQSSSVKSFRFLYLGSTHEQDTLYSYERNVVAICKCCKTSTRFSTNSHWPGLRYKITIFWIGYISIRQNCWYWPATTNQIIKHGQCAVPSCHDILFQFLHGYFHLFLLLPECLSCDWAVTKLTYYFACYSYHSFNGR